MQTALDKTILACRHILTVFLLGLCLALGLYALRFLWKVGKYATTMWTAEDSEVLLALLHMLDSALVASLVVMVAISTYDGLVSPLGDGSGGRIGWIAKLDPGSLKIKLSASIVAISSIQLLQVFLKPQGESDRDVMWAVMIHALFLAGVLMLALVDRLTAGGKAKG
jgi:uncharacterized protein (TIGR00645 family)